MRTEGQIQHERELRRVRIGRFSSLVDRRGLRCAVLSSPQHIYYLSGFLPPDGRYCFLVMMSDRQILITSSDLLQRIEGCGLEATVAPYEHDRLRSSEVSQRAALRALSEAIAKAGVGRGPLGVEAHHLSGFFTEEIRRTCGLEDVGILLEEMRICKDAAEVAQIARIVSMIDCGFATAARAVRPGATELEVKQAVETAIIESGGSSGSFDGDFVSGPRTLGIGGPATLRSLESQDLLIVDLLPRVGAYYGDSARTFVVGQPSDQQRRIHAVLEGALMEAQEAIRPHTSAAELDGIIRRHISDHGYGSYFPHHSGHGIGLFPYEAPYIIPADGRELDVGMVFTLEPGVYVPGLGGMRLEQAYVVTSEGYELLTGYEPRLIRCDQGSVVGHGSGPTFDAVYEARESKHRGLPE